MADNYILCLDIGSKSIKACFLINSNIIQLATLLNINSNDIVTTNKEDFISYVNYSYNEISESVFNLFGTEKDDDGNLIISKLYPEEILEQQLHYIFDEVKNIYNRQITHIAVTLPRDGVTKCAAILSGLNIVRFIQPELAIAHTYATELKVLSDPKYLLLIDLGCSALRLYIVKYSSNEEPNILKKEIHNDWSSNEFNVNLYNYLISINAINKSEGLKLCEEIKKVYSTNGKHDLITQEKFEYIIQFTVKRLCNKVKTLVRNFKKETTYDVSNVLLIGGSAKLPIVVRSVERLLEINVCDIKKKDPEYVIAYCIAVYTKDKIG